MKASVKRIIRARILVAALGTWAALSLTACAHSQEATAMVNREIEMLQFYGGGSPLTAAERQQAAAIIQQGLHDDPENMRRGDAGSAKLLTELANADGATISMARAVGRRNVALPVGIPPGLRAMEAKEAAIVEAHDPTVVVDAAHRRLVTRATVLSLLRADAQAASLFQVAPADVHELDAMAAALKAAYPRLDDGMQDMLAHAGEDLPYAVPYLERAPAQKRAAFVAQFRPKILAGPNPVQQHLLLAEVLAGAGLAGSRQQAAAQPDNAALRGSLLDRLRQQDMMQRQLLGASRSFSPTCNVPSGANQENFSFCHP